MSLREKILKLFHNKYCVKVGFATIGDETTEMLYFVVESKDGKIISSNGDEQFAKYVLTQLEEEFNTENSKVVIEARNWFRTTIERKIRSWV